jgi:hypothetical protein
MPPKTQGDPKKEKKEAAKLADIVKRREALSPLQKELFGEKIPPQNVSTFLAYTKDFTLEDYKNIGDTQLDNFLDAEKNAGRTADATLAKGVGAIRAFYKKRFRDSVGAATVTNNLEFIRLDKASKDLASNAKSNRRKEAASLLSPVQQELFGTEIPQERLQSFLAYTKDFTLEDYKNIGDTQLDNFLDAEKNAGTKTELTIGRNVAAMRAFYNDRFYKTGGYATVQEHPELTRLQSAFNASERRVAGDKREKKNELMSTDSLTGDTTKGQGKKRTRDDGSVSAPAAPGPSIRFAVPSNDPPDRDAQLAGFRSLQPREMPTGNVITDLFKEWNNHNENTFAADGQADVYFVTPAEMEKHGLSLNAVGAVDVDDQAAEWLAQRPQQRLVLPINHGNNEWSSAEYYRETGEMHHVDPASTVKHREGTLKVLGNLFSCDWPRRILLDDDPKQGKVIPYDIQQQVNEYDSVLHCLGTAAGIQDRRNGENVGFQLENSVPFDRETVREHLAFTVLCDELNSTQNLPELIRSDTCSFKVDGSDILRGSAVVVVDKKTGIPKQSSLREELRVPAAYFRSNPELGITIEDFENLDEFRSNKRARTSGYAPSSVSLSKSTRVGASTTADSMAFSQDPSSLYGVGPFDNAGPSGWQEDYELGALATDTPAVAMGEPETYDYDAVLGAWGDEDDNDNDNADIMMWEASESERNAPEYPELETQGDLGGYGIERSPLSGTMGGVDWNMPYDMPQRPAFEEPLPSMDPRLQEAAGTPQPSLPGLGEEGEQSGFLFEDFLHSISNPPSRSPSPTRLHSALNVGRDSRSPNSRDAHEGTAMKPPTSMQR